MNLAVLGAIAASNRDHGYSFWNNGNPHSNVFKYVQINHPNETTSIGSSSTPAKMTSSVIQIDDTLTLDKYEIGIGCEKTFTKADMERYKSMVVRLKKNATFSGEFKIGLTIADHNGELKGSSISNGPIVSISGITNSDFDSTTGLYNAVFDLSNVVWSTPIYSYRVLFTILKTSSGGTAPYNWDIQKWQLLK